MHSFALGANLITSLSISFSRGQVQEVQAFFTCSSQYAYRLHVDPKKPGVNSNPLRIDLMLFRSSSLLARDSIFDMLLQSIFSFSVSVSYQEKK